MICSGENPVIRFSPSPLRRGLGEVFYQKLGNSNRILTRQFVFIIETLLIFAEFINSKLIRRDTIYAQKT